MTLRLVRTLKREDGVFGQLFGNSDELLAFTLEHAYDSGHGDGTYLSKIPPGVYKCVKGQHRLHSMKQPFITFEVTGVTGHSNILFHVGNYNKDSDGCVLLGQACKEVNGKQMLVSSRLAFQHFIEYLQGIDNFTLTVKDV